MDTLALALARWQFAVLTIIHFFFVPLTLGITILLAILETLYVRTQDEVYKDMVKFWGKVFLVNFALGVVSGIVQEFQFGMNWSEYSRFMGDIFGAPLAIEALLAFYLESTFIGVWVFGWEKLSPKLHAATMWLIALGSNISALWILIANSFMQEPVGYVIRNGRAEMVDFFALITNPNVWVQFPHVLAAGIATAGFVILGLSAYLLLRGRRDAMVMRSFRVAAVYALLGTLLVVLVGHTQAQHIVAVQPMKMAAAEALQRSENPASFSILTITDEATGRELISLRIPYLLSILAYNRPSGEVKGIQELQAAYEARYGPGNYVPPINVTYWSFRLMVGAGFLMLALAAWAVYLVARERFADSPRFLKGLVWATALPYLASTTGWILTEVGRQPWIVFGLQRVEDAVSPTVSAGEIAFSLIFLLVLYILGMYAGVYLIGKHLRSAVASPQSVGAS